MAEVPGFWHNKHLKIRHTHYLCPALTHAYSIGSGPVPLTMGVSGDLTLAEFMGQDSGRSALYYLPDKEACMLNGITGYMVENHKLVLPEHLNQFGYLFGGNLLKWVDEIAWIAASLDFPGCKFVTIGMDKVEFKKSLREGSILKFVVERIKTGNTSVQYAVIVFKKDIGTGDETEVFSTRVTFVCIDNKGDKATILT